MGESWCCATVYELCGSTIAAVTASASVKDGVSIVIPSTRGFKSVGSGAKNKNMNSALGGRFRQNLGAAIHSDLLSHSSVRERTNLKTASLILRLGFTEMLRPLPTFTSTKYRGQVQESELHMTGGEGRRTLSRSSLNQE